MHKQIINYGSAYYPPKCYCAMLFKNFAAITGDKALLQNVAEMSAEEGAENISFVAYFMLNDLESCLKLLIQRNKLPEAAFFAR